MGNPDKLIPVPEEEVGFLSEEEDVDDSGIIERPKGRVKVIFTVELGSEIQMQRFMGHFALGLIDVGVQGSEIKKVATADRVTKGPDGEEVLERVDHIGPRQ